MPIIELRSISKIYGYGDATTVALDDINLDVEKGEFVSIMGPSGSGKSTLMNIIGLLDTPTHGSYKLEGQPVAHLSEKARAIIRRRKIGFVFQSFNLLPNMTVIENVALPLMYDGVGYLERIERASKVLEMMGLKDREYYRPNQLSGGQAQRAAIARALVTDPAIILADEPTGNLDTNTGEVIMSILEDLNNQGRTIMMVTHDPNVAKHSKRLVELVNGKIVSDKAVRKPAKRKSAKKKRAAKSRKSTTTKKRKAKNATS